MEDVAPMLARAIAAEVRQADESLTQVAAGLGVSYGGLRGWMSGRGTPNGIALMALQRRFPRLRDIADQSPAAAA